MRRLLCSVVVVASVAPLLVSGSRAPASGANGVLIPAGPHERLPLSGTTVLSNNWSGYAVRSSTHAISAATATFVVPTASRPPSGYASTWVGIGGFSTRDLIQAGIAEQTATPRYYAWWEELPRSAARIANKPVSPGDHVRVAVSRLSPNRWRISLSDAGHWGWTKTVAYSSSRSSAEWVLESPSINGRQTTLPRLSRTSFRPTSTFVKSGTTRTIAKGNPIKILMTTDLGRREATPSALATNGESFNDCAWSKNCSAP